MEVAQVDPHDAAQALRARGLRAPLPCDTPEGIAAGGDCFALRDGAREMVFVIRRKGDVLWVDGAAGGGGVLAMGLELGDAIARELGCETVAFETARPGLVRLAERDGFEVKGWVLARKVER